FQGYAGFYKRFIKGFSGIELPLCNLLGKDVPFEWGHDCEVAFCKLKEMLTSYPIMQTPN
ncbi:hypothetical protein KK467_29445, partial [Klebsiella pneumoniae]|uniref:hypothetical protein n=1 Tax=Klebsiella pneumoniae TaxID=573 RepID=UPI001BDF7813